PYNPWGSQFQDLTVKGFIDGKQITEHKIASDHLPCKLLLTATTSTLTADGIDMTRVAVQVIDRYSNVLPYQNRLVEVMIEGEAELVGATPLMLLGGQAAMFIKAGCTAGRAVITAHTQGLPPETITLEIEANG
ncbi:MAG: beta-galactosidase, partial [Anaerolineae bacterium]|nr:beta-galactosidase [Anaerolineae bacterium]